MLAALPLAALPLILWLGPALADGMETGCQYAVFANSYFLRDGREVFDEGRHTAFALRLETAVYKSSTGNDVIAGKTLGFSQRVRISDPGKDADRLEVKDAGRNDKIGWVNRADVLCRVLPLIDSGLYRRAVVRTEQAERGQVRPRKAYHGPDGRCEGGEQRCLEVTRMRWYFIYGEENGYLLLSEYSRLGDPETRLFGWLPKADAIGWNTSLGLRPSEELAARPGPGGASEDYICAFKSRAEASDPSKCNQILGGKIWFKKDTRILNLREDAEGYDVAFTSAATADRDYPGLVEPVRNVDVFFVIDGTQSMEPAIAGVKETVTRVMSTVKGRIQRGAEVRFGYRVYRDSVRGGPDGVQNSERLLFDPTKCTVGNEEEFKRSFAVVKAKDLDGDPDYSENSFGGIVQAAEDASVCPDNIKLVFVIGDHGYDAAAQAGRNHRALTVANVAARFKRDGNDPKRHNPRFSTPPLVFFLQTPSKCEGPTCKQADYDAAYRAFEQQALAILGESYAGMTSDFFKRPGYFFLQLRGDNVAQQVGDWVDARVGQLFQPGAVNELRSRLSAGQSLVAAIKALQQEDKLDIPIAWSQFVEEALCQRLGEQCRTAVIQAVNEAFIPRRHDADITKELLISAEQLRTWLKVLENFKQFFGGNIGTRERQRQVVSALLQGLGAVLQVDFQSDGSSLFERARMQANLPNASKSPLLQYSSNDLTGEQTSLCELDYLAVYGAKRYDILFNIQDGITLVDFRDMPVPPTTCRGALSEKGKRVPFIEGQVIPRRINPPGVESEYKLMHERGGENWFWIPIRYMP